MAILLNPVKDVIKPYNDLFRSCFAYCSDGIALTMCTKLFEIKFRHILYKYISSNSRTGEGSLLQLF